MSHLCPLLHLSSPSLQPFPRELTSAVLPSVKVWWQWDCSVCLVKKDVGRNRYIDLTSICIQLVYYIYLLIFLKYQVWCLQVFGVSGVLQMNSLAQLSSAAISAETLDRVFFFPIRSITILHVLSTCNIFVKISHLLMHLLLFLSLCCFPFLFLCCLFGGISGDREEYCMWSFHSV